MLWLALAIAGYLVLGLAVLWFGGRSQAGFVMPPMWYMAAMVVFFPQVLIIAAIERWRSP